MEKKKVVSPFRLHLALLLIAAVGASTSPRDYCRTGTAPHSSIRRCCLQHSSCPLLIERGAKKYSLVNDLAYPLYYCRCEVSFYKCLSRVDTGRSVSTRKAHFLEDGNALRKCFAVEEKKICTNRFMGMMCVRHEVALRASLHSISDFL